MCIMSEAIDATADVVLNIRAMIEWKIYIHYKYGKKEHSSSSTDWKEFYFMVMRSIDFLSGCHNFC